MSFLKNYLRNIEPKGAFYLIKSTSGTHKGNWVSKRCCDLPKSHRTLRAAPLSASPPLIFMSLLIIRAHSKNVTAPSLGPPSHWKGDVEIIQVDIDQHRKPLPSPIVCSFNICLLRTFYCRHCARTEDSVTRWSSFLPSCSCPCQPAKPTYVFQVDTNTLFLRHTQNVGKPQWRHWVSTLEE